MAGKEGEPELIKGDQSGDKQSSESRKNVDEYNGRGSHVIRAPVTNAVGGDKCCGNEFNLLHV